MWVVLTRSVLCCFLCYVVIVKPIITEGSFLDAFLGLEMDNFFCADLTSKCNDNFFDDGNDDSDNKNNNDDGNDNDNVDVVEVSNDGEVLVTRVFIDLTGGRAWFFVCKISFIKAGIDNINVFFDATYANTARVHAINAQQWTDIY